MYIIELYLKRSESYVLRVVKTFEKIDVNEQFNQEVAEFEGELSQLDIDMDEAYYMHMNMQSSLADEFLLFGDGLYASALSGFMHLWERDVKDLCIRLSKRRTVEKASKSIEEQDVEKFSFKGIKFFLGAFGVDEDFFHEIYKLSLIVNVVKHGSGNSSEKLKQLDETMHSKLSMLCNLETSIKDDSDFLSLSIEDVQYFGQVLILFWSKLKINY